MLTVIAVSVFLAVSLGTVALFWWMEGKRDTLVRRFQGVISPSAGPASPSPGGAWGWASRLFGGSDGSARQREEIVARVTSDDLAGHRLLLNRAGYRSTGAHRFYLMARIGVPGLLTAVAVAAGLTKGLPNRLVFLLAVGAGLAGLCLPPAFLKMKARRRQEEITDSLPDGLDLMTVCVEAGLGINSTFVRIADEFRFSSPTLSEEFDIVNREMVAGKPRAEALRALSERTGVEDVKSLVAMLIQTEKLGTSLAQSLRVHSDSLRTRRRQRAEEAAAKTTIKLVFPLVFLLFPALFIVILGPGALQIFHVLLPAAAGQAGG